MILNHIINYFNFIFSYDIVLIPIGYVLTILCTILRISWNIYNSKKNKEKYTFKIFFKDIFWMLFLVLISLAIYITKYV